MKNGLVNQMIILYSKLLTVLHFLIKSEGKLEHRTRKCIFLDYPEGVKGYRLWDINQNVVKIIVSRDVTFNETKMPSLKTESKPISEEEKGEERYQLKVELGRLRTSIPTILNEVETLI